MQTNHDKGPYCILHKFLIYVNITFCILQNNFIYSFVHIHKLYCNIDIFMIFTSVAAGERQIWDFPIRDIYWTTSKFYKHLSPMNSKIRHFGMDMFIQIKNVPCQKLFPKEHLLNSHYLNISRLKMKNPLLPWKHILYLSQDANFHGLKYTNCWGQNMIQI